MKRIFAMLLGILLLAALAVPSLAASDEPVITLQPQSPNTPHYGVAIYTVKATGTNLTATWYIEWQGTTYNASDRSAMQPWEAYAGESYGPRQADANTFTFIFEGIERDLDGASIWCVIEDGHYSVTSQKARIWVGNENTAPIIESMPSAITVEQGAVAELRVIAKSPDGSQLTYLWYESDTGRIEDIRAVNRGTETSDFMLADTSAPGKRNYICLINTANGGYANTSFVTVTVTEKTVAAVEPVIQTDSLPEATVGVPYAVSLGCTDPNASFIVYYNPGNANDFDKTGLTLSKNGQLSGTPTAAGSYGFCICAAGAGGEDYKVYTLTVKEAAPAATEATTPATTVPETTAAEATTAATAATTSPAATEAPDEPASTGAPWWVLVLVGIAAAGAGVGVAFLLIKKKS